MSLIDAAYKVLNIHREALKAKEIWKKAEEYGYVKPDSHGKTPWASLGRDIYEDIKKGDRSQFIKVNPGTFKLKESAPNNIPIETKRGYKKVLDYKILEEKQSDAGRKDIMENQQLISLNFENRLKDDVKNTLKKLSPKSFQDFVIKGLFPRLGLTEINMRPFSKDGGIDGEGLLEISEETIIAGVIEKKSRRVKCGIQVKRWEAIVSRPDIQTFRGAISGQFERGLYITTSCFTKEALEEAHKNGVIPITAIDINMLASLLIEKGVGIKEITVKVLDQQYFSSF